MSNKIERIKSLKLSLKKCEIKEATMTNERLINGHERDVPKGTPECQNALKGPHYGGTIAMYGGLTATWWDNSRTNA